ncbi:MAG: NAD-dependent epimerase/dehydratase family protein [Kiritimatiellae bacterium]|nr:NAD-dependent epimerase/dehydratase family protein [Kiritimatiellia bacterium]
MSTLILITGAYGFVGKNLCQYLVANGYQCDALDLAESVCDAVPYRHHYTWDNLDLLLPHLKKYAAIIHLAGKAHDLKNVSDPQSYFDINVGLTKKIFDLTHQQVAKFIYFSTSKVLDSTTPYAESKREAEHYLADQAIILRPAMIHGPGNKGNLNLLWKITQYHFPWPLAAFENKRSFASIDNICAVVLALIQRGKNGIYTVADDTPLSTNQIIQMMASVQGRKAHLWRIPKAIMRWCSKVGDLFHLPLNSERLHKLTEDSLLDNTLLKKHLNWDTMPIDAINGMFKTLQSFKSGESR